MLLLMKRFQIIIIYLLRVRNNITMFEEDKVKIMTTITIETQEAGLLRSNSQWSIELMKDNKGQIPEHYKSKIDKISRNAYYQMKKNQCQ